jgi:hypothetical protein
VIIGILVSLDLWVGIVFANGFVGPFGGETKNPILFVSNTLDPITAIEKYVFPHFPTSSPRLQT